MSEIERVSQLAGLAQEDAIRDLFQHVHDLDPLALARFRGVMATLGINARAFNTLLKVEQAKTAEIDSPSDVLDDRIPLVSPALGFSNELALVTVSLRERTKGNRLRIQPYLVTSDRELIRLNGNRFYPLVIRKSCCGLCPKVRNS